MTDIDQSGAQGIVERLDHIVRLLTAIVTKDMSRKEAVMTLSATGLPPKEVASILGLSGQQVSVILYEAKQAAAKQAKASTSSAAKA